MLVISTSERWGLLAGDQRVAGKSDFSLRPPGLQMYLKAKSHLYLD